MRYFFIEQSELSGTTAVISGSDARHIKTVLRLKPGDKIGLYDGRGVEYRAEIISFSPERINVSITDSFPSSAESPIQIAIAQAFLKEKKMDGLVRQLTELGITKWIPFFAERSISRPDKNKSQRGPNGGKKLQKRRLSSANEAV